MKPEDIKLQKEWLKTNKIKYYNRGGKEISKKKYKKKEIFYSDPQQTDKGPRYASD